MLRLKKALRLITVLPISGVIALGSCAALASIFSNKSPSLVSTSGLVASEGVAAGPDGQIFVSDITVTAAVPNNNPGGSIYRYNPTTNFTTKFLEPSGMTVGIHFDRFGNMYLAQGADGGARSLARISALDGVPRAIASSYQGKPFNGLNDITSDSYGRIYFTDAFYFGSETRGLPNAVYRLDSDGAVIQLLSDILRPNGIAVSPDGKKLYVAAFNDSATTGLPINPNGPTSDRFGITFGGVVEYDLLRNGTPTNGRVLYRNDTLGVDGMRVDSAGNLFLALHNGNPFNPIGQVQAIDAKGNELGHITLPDGAIPSNLGFGRGKDCRNLYIAAAFQWKLYKVRTNTCGLHY